MVSTNFSYNDTWKIEVMANKLLNNLTPEN